MNKAYSVKKLTITALCIALCYALPLLFHATGLGTAFSPMHIPVLLCGLVCGGGYGLVCGVVGPVLSSILSGMPPAVKLVHFIPELAVYGALAGLMLKLVRTKKNILNVYIALITAMVAGRIVGGIAQALFYLSSGKEFTVAAIAAGYFVSTLPGIICHLIVVPILVMALLKARLIADPYTEGA